ncbi:MAG: hypothetical protein ACLQNE_13380 [Thermoguttaceae bacterium]
MKAFVSMIAAIGLLAAPAAAEEWQSIRCIPADPSPEEMFDVTQAIDDFEAGPLKWEALHDGQNAKAAVRRDSAQHHGGDAALRVDYEFTGRKDLEYVQINRKLDFPQPGLGVGFWVKTDGTPFHFCLRVTDRSGETHQLAMPSANRAGWQFVAVPLSNPSTAWGGDGNRRMDYPCRLAGICIDRPQVGFAGRGSLRIDDVALLHLHKPAPSTLTVEVRPKRFGNLYAVGQPVSIRARGQGDLIRWSFSDFWGTELARGQGAPSDTVAKFAPQRTGYFAGTIELLDPAAKPLEKQIFAIAVLPSRGTAVRSDFLGMCTHFGQNSCPLECMELLRNYSMDQFRDEIGWGGFEVRKGKYSMPEHSAAYLKHAAELKMRPLVIFDYGNPHYDDGGFPHSPQALAGFAAYAVELVRQTQDTVNQFEVWNEWVGGCGMDGKPGPHDGAAYGRMLKPAYEAVKQAFPGVTVVGIGGEYGPKCAETIVAAIKTGGARSMDAWSIHPYRYPQSAEESDLAGEVQGIAARVAQAGAAQKAWVTEIGWPTHRASTGSDEHAQACHAVRAVAILQSTGVVEKVFWYDFKDDGLNREDNESNFGVVRNQSYNCAPKPAVVALALFLRLTHGAPCGPLWHEGKAYAVAYRLPDGRQRLVAWALAPGTPVRVSGTLADVRDLMGNPRDRGGPHLLGPEPTYWTGTDLRLGR